MRCSFGKLQLNKRRLEVNVSAGDVRICLYQASEHTVFYIFSNKIICHTANFFFFYAGYPAGVPLLSLDADAVAHVYHTGPEMCFAKC